MIAALPMYARLWNRAAHDALWVLIRDGLRARDVVAPDDLDYDVDHVAVWSRPDLVLGHICNLPYRARFRDKVTVIGASDYGLPHAPPGHYTSVFVVRADEETDDIRAFANRRFAVNDLMSQSGYGAPQQWAAKRGLAFTDPLITGAHAASIDAVLSGTADIAAIDAQTWRMSCHDETPTERLRVLGHTHPSPGMTFITRKGQDPDPYFDAVAEAITALPTYHADILGLRGIVALPSSAYDIPLPPKAAASAR